MYKLSPSSLSLFQDCPLCFWLRFRKGVKHPPTIFPSLPSGMDSILKKHFDCYRAKGALPPELGELEGVKLFDDTEKLREWRNNFKGIRFFDKERDAVLFGAIDDMLVKEDGKMIVLDFKTRGFPLKDDTHTYYQSHLNLYTFLLQQNGHPTENYAYLLFYHPSEVKEDGSVLFNTDLVKMNTKPEDAEELFHKAVEVLGKGEPPAAEECGHCVYVGERG